MPRDGIEPPTRGFSVPVAMAPNALQHKVMDNVAAPSSPDLPRGGAADLAMELLLAIDEGRPAGDVARALALAVLTVEAPGSAPWTAAVAVLEGGPLRVRRAVMLAGEILDGVSKPAAPTRGAQ